MYRSYFKSSLDFTIAAVIFVILFPLMLICAVIIKLNSAGPIFFTQTRAGKGGKAFLLYKFRTMYHKKRTVKEEILKDNAEVTKFGYYLRRFKIDELPQIINILKGDMSIVGPRPSLPSQIPELDENGKTRLLVKPGLTGLAQINGNIYLPWNERWKYDRRYVENLSFFNDVIIILKTVAIVILGEERFLKKPANDV